MFTARASLKKRIATCLFTANCACRNFTATFEPIDGCSPT